MDDLLSDTLSNVTRDLVLEATGFPGWVGDLLLMLSVNRNCSVDQGIMLKTK